MSTKFVGLKNYKHLIHSLNLT